MTPPEGTDTLEQRSSEELHDLAVGHAVKHLDVGFFWELMKLLPAAEAAAGELDEATADVMTLRSRLDDVMASGRAPIADALRPFYLDYLRRR